MPDPIHVIQGSCDGQFDLAGRTVGDLRKALAVAFNIPTNAVAFVNGEQANASYVLMPGDQVEFVKPARKTIKKARRKQRIAIIGCGQMAKCLIHPLLWHLESLLDLDAEIRAVDGDEEKVSNLIEADGQVVPIPEYLVAANAERIIEEGDAVLSCTRNTATLKLISDHVETLANVTVIAGGCDYLDGAVKFFDRRKGKRLTLPLETLPPRDSGSGRPKSGRSGGERNDARIAPEGGRERQHRRSRFAAAVDGRQWAEMLPFCRPFLSKDLSKTDYPKRGVSQVLVR